MSHSIYNSAAYKGKCASTESPQSFIRMGIPSSPARTKEPLIEYLTPDRQQPTLMDPSQPTCQQTVGIVLAEHTRTALPINAPRVAPLLMTTSVHKLIIVTTRGESYISLTQQVTQRNYIWLPQHKHTDFKDNEKRERDFSGNLGCF